MKVTVIIDKSGNDDEDGGCDDGRIGSNNHGDVKDDIHSNSDESDINALIIVLLLLHLLIARVEPALVCFHMVWHIFLLALKYFLTF